MTTVKRPKDKAVLSKQDIVARRKALKEKKMGSSNTGRRAIVGVFILAFSVLSFLSIATFDAHDRVGPGFRNAIGPVGHAIGEAFRGLLGIVALVVPMVGFYAAGVLFVGDRERKRWPQLVSFVLFLVSGAILAQLLFKEDASWAHAPGGLIGRELGGFLTALFSTVGTVVLVSAIAATAAIVGTQYAFLRFCAWASEKSLLAFDAAKAWALTAWAEQQKRLEERKLEAEKAKAEEEAFLSQLEEEEAELAELEAAAQEAEAAAEEAERLQKNQEETRARAIAEKEKLRLERERLAAFVRRVLFHHASEEATVRIGEAAVGLASAGALFGAGFAAEGNDMSLSHSLWVGSGITALGSLARFFIASDLEHLAAEADEKSEEQLRRDWRALTESAQVERRTGAVFGTLIGGTSMVFGALVMSEEIGDLSDDNRKILGTALLAGGGIGVAQSVVDWFVLSPTERGFALADGAPRMQMTAAPTPGGLSVGLQGVF